MMEEHVECDRAYVKAVDDGLRVELIPDEYPCVELHVRPAELLVDRRRWEHIAQDPGANYADEILLEGDEITLHSAMVTGVNYIDEGPGATETRLKIETLGMKR